VYVLHVTIPGELVDVNVHPQKREVRLRQELALKEMLVQAVAEALQGTKITPWETIVDTITNIPEIPQKLEENEWAPPPSVERESPAVASYASSKYELPTLESISSAKAATRSFSQPMRQEQFLPAEVTPQPAVPRVLATLKHYILIESVQPPEGLCLVDQKAAHARVIFEKLESQRNGEVPIQGLLIPYAFDATGIESSLLLENLEALNQLGISVHQAGPQRFLVDALPVCFGNVDVQQLIGTLIEKMRDYQDKETLKREQIKQLSMAASRASISQRVRLSAIEAQSLIDQLMRCTYPHHCPTGRFTMITLTYEELSKKFISQQRI
jgi:DNA mismatch repair protein MutL